MLQHVNTTEQQEGAANVRLTMEELARAISRHETQRMAEPQAPPDTMTIGEAIEQLSLNATPEELLAEVEAERRRAEEENLKNPPWKSQVRLEQEQMRLAQEVRRRRSVRRKFVILGAFLGASLLLNLRLIAANVEERRAYAFLPPPSGFAVPVEMAPPALTMEDAVPLSSLQDGESAFANLDTINQLANGKSANETFVHTERERDGRIWNSEWMLVRLNGKWYVRGWATPNLSYNGSHQYNFLSNNTEEMSGLTTRTVPVEKFKTLLDPTYIDQESKVRGVFIRE